ncbi:signal transduction histidine kinase [Methanofollis sp. W23]|uniref:sensor histidine kinase n=1 Tax=Methanofollis sp. W23 TaxID=2817849 RepID=UPI001D6351BA|nr:HAMP domain-containing sensor histidine kinase [Methanofollis sp. W23]MBP2144780.1 signal transduction histidine kinase [Methanofollis sp. W23]
MKCRKERPFNQYLMAFFILFIVTVIAILSSVSYIEARDELVEKNLLLQEETEKSILQWMTLVDAGLKKYDDSLNEKMRNGFKGFLEEYERSGRDPSQMNLWKLKEDLGGEMDLYIVNADGVIEYSTYEKEVGLDFKEVPYFYEYITDLREAGTFSADRVVREQSTRKVRKFAYMPTPDHRYLFELGLVTDMLKDRSLDLSYVETGENLKELNPDLTTVRFFDTMGNVVGNKSYVMPPLQQARVERALAERAGATYQDSAHLTEVHYLFLDLQDPDYASDMSVVIELTYTTAPLQQKLNTLFISQLTISLLAVLLSIVLAYGGSRYISGPISEVVEDIDQIAHGDLDHTIRQTKGIEFSRLENAINAMVLVLKENIRRTHESEEALRHYSENLETIVDQRTAELKVANEEANLYLDIMSHDINNANAVSMGYTQLLLLKLPQTEREDVERIRQSILRSSGIIQNVATIRRIHQEDIPLRTVDLDSVIREEVGHHHEEQVRYERRKKVLVRADALLPEVFSNLIGNALKFMEEDGTVCIRVEDREDEVLVSVEDTGPGIPDPMKESVFNRFKKGEHMQSGKGLGLYIVRSLVERYGGTVWADDRVKGAPEKGAAVRFTLQKVQDREEGRQA